MSGQINRWRKNMLKIPPTSMHKMSQAKVRTRCHSPRDTSDSSVVPRLRSSTTSRPPSAPSRTTGVILFIFPATGSSTTSGRGRRRTA